MKKRKDVHLRLSEEDYLGFMLLVSVESKRKGHQVSKTDCLTQMIRDKYQPLVWKQCGPTGEECKSNEE